MKFSIITINLNGNLFLGNALRSVLEQDYKNLELIVVDGGSTDGSLETIKSVASQDRRVQWISEPDDGISCAMNKGLHLASGDVVAYLHSDDIYPDAQVLALVADQLEDHPDALWLTGGLNMLDPGGRVFKTLPARGYSYSRMVRSNILFHPATFVRMEGFRKAGDFDESLKLAMDYDLWLRLGAYGDPVCIQAALASFRIHDDSLSTAGADRALDEEFQIRRRYLQDMKRAVWPYALHHQIKRVMNRSYIERVRQAAKERMPHA